MDSLPSELICTIVNKDNFHLLINTCKRINSICSDFASKNLTMIVLRNCDSICSNIKNRNNSSFLSKIYKVAERANLFDLLCQTSINMCLYYDDNMSTVESIIKDAINEKSESRRLAKRNAFIHCLDVWISENGIPIAISNMVSNNMSFLYTLEQYQLYTRDWKDFKIWCIHYVKYMFSDHPYIESLIGVIKSYCDYHCRQLSRDLNKLETEYTTLIIRLTSEMGKYPAYVTVFRYFFITMTSKHKNPETRTTKEKFIKFISDICPNKDKLAKLLSSV